MEMYGEPESGLTDDPDAGVEPEHEDAVVDGDPVDGEADDELPEIDLDESEPE